MRRCLFLSLLLSKIIESFRLEKTFKAIESNRRLYIILLATVPSNAVIPTDTIINSREGNHVEQRKFF